MENKDFTKSILIQVHCVTEIHHDYKQTNSMHARMCTHTWPRQGRRGVATGH